MEPIRFTVFGHAEPAGSKRAFRHPHTGQPIITDANPKARGWKDCVAAAAADAYCGPLLDGALSLSLTFFRPRPKGHFRTGKMAGLLRESAPLYPSTKPDSLKLARGVEDALTGVVYRDDALVVELEVRKRYGEPARVEIMVVECVEQTIGAVVADSQLAIAA